MIIGVEDATHYVVGIKEAHPWRICPLGQHFVRTHIEHIPPSKTHPQGEVITRHEHCAHNPSHKDMLSLDEIQVVSSKHFEDLTGSPTAAILTDFDNADTSPESTIRDFRIVRQEGNRKVSREIEHYPRKSS